MSIRITCCDCEQKHIDDPNIQGCIAKIDVLPENAAKLLFHCGWHLTERGWQCSVHRPPVLDGQTFVPMSGAKSRAIFERMRAAHT